MNMINLVRQLRKDQTNAEHLLWERVRRNQLGYKIKRQKPLVFEYKGKKRYFIADFYCEEKRLVIELDGAVHNEQKDYDEMRTHLIEQLGLKVIRFTNTEVINNKEAVIERIIEA